MAEPRRTTDPDAPQNPPASVLNRNVRRSAVRAYLAPLVVFFAGVGLVLAFWVSTRPSATRDVAEIDASGTSGTERDAAGERTPGGHNPDPVPSNASEEIERRGGDVITGLGDVLEEGGRGAIGRPVALRGVNVERVESPTLLWVRDGDARVAVITQEPTESIAPGQPVSISGTVERAGDTVRIRAVRVQPNR